MKKYFVYLLTAIVAMSFAACDDELLETTPTDKVSGAGLFSNATAALVPLNGIYRLMYEQGWSTTSNVQQCDGLTAWNLCAEVMGDDCIMAATGNGWYWYDCVYNVKSRYTSGGWRSYDLWNGYYTLISNANYIIDAEETMEGTPSEVNYVIGQAYAIRAYCYFQLANYFSRPYVKGDSDRMREKCVPIYTAPSAAGTEGQPRSSIQATYAQIKSDIDKAVAMLKDSHAPTHKTHIGYAVACGIQSRIYLAMQDYDGALTAAREAQAGYTVANASECLAGFNSLKQGDVMWGAEIIPDQTPGYGPFLYHMDGISMYLVDGSQIYGYSAPKCMNDLVYKKMGANDVRRGWWLSGDELEEDFGIDLTDAIGFQPEHMQYKFRFSDASQSLGDKMWMRVEEMYLTEAECLCRKGDEAGAKSVLNAFVQTRDADYDCSAKTGTSLGKTTCEFTGSLLEEILIQRRIELWGEYGRLIDIRRLGQGIKRTEEQGYPTDALLANTDVQDPDTWAWVLTIPQKEFDGNKNLDFNKDQNPTILKGQPANTDNIYAE